MIIAIATISCTETIKGNGNVIEVNRKVDDFSHVRISGAFEIELLKGSSGLTVIADENLHDHIISRVENGMLEINSDGKLLHGEELRLQITGKDFRALEILGAAQISTPETVKTDAFLLDVSGACEGLVNLKVKRLDIEIAGGGDMTLSGFADDCFIKISGAGEVNAEDLQTEIMDVEITGAGEVLANVATNLNVEITGAGEVKYLGNPEVMQHITGAGSVTNISN